MNWIDKLAPKASKLYELMNDVRYFSKANPYLFNIENQDPVPNNYQMFGSAAYRFVPNYGNIGNIKFRYGYSTYTFDELMANTESTPVRIGKIRVESNNPLNLNSVINIIRYDSDGSQIQDSNVAFRRINQFLQGAIEFETSIELNTHTLVTGIIQPNSSATVYLYFDYYSSMKMLLNEGYLAKKTTLSPIPTTPNVDSVYTPLPMDIRNEIY